MKAIRHTIYKSPAEIDTAIENLETALELLPVGDVRQRVLIQIAQLRSYAEMKRLLGSPEFSTTTVPSD